jgi:RimJ/RimL family protein N-acetyltransferase
MSWIVGSRQDHGPGTGLTSRGLFPPVPASPPRNDLRVGDGKVLDTDRLRLCEVPVDEVRSILDGRTVEGAVWRRVTRSTGRSAVRSWSAARVDAGTYRPGFGLSQVVLGADGTVVGDIGFHAAPDEGGSVEIGYGAGASPPRRPGRWSGGRCVSPV